MATPSSINRDRERLLSQYQCFRVGVRNLTLGCAILFVVTLACSLLSPATLIVHASPESGKAVGATLFHERGCEHCHGADGHGGELGPDLSTVGKRRNKQQIEHQIHDGGAAMPAFGDVLQEDEIKDLVEFLQAKRKAAKNSSRPSI
jgi:mono/diheme cytochrome c family protein